MSGQHPGQFSMLWMRSSISILTRAVRTKMPSARSTIPLKMTDLRKIGGGCKVFCNPPYGRELPKWVRKCFEEAKKPDTLVVMLIPARTDTAYFHDYIYHRAREIRFLRGRLHFNESRNAAPFPSMIVVF